MLLSKTSQQLSFWLFRILRFIPQLFSKMFYIEVTPFPRREGDQGIIGLGYPEIRGLTDQGILGLADYWIRVLSHLVIHGVLL